MVTLLLTKLYVPQVRPGWVPRPHLISRLDAGLNRALTLISAPAGYGKSTLAAEWLAQAKRPAAWLSLEPADDEPLRFFTYFVAALQRVDAQIGRELAEALAAGHLPPREAIVTTLANDLVCANVACLVALDDFQWIQDADILAALQGLLTHHPPRFHLLVITRADPALPLTLWRAQDQLTEIRATDLRFTEEEAAQFMRQSMGLELSATDLARLAERTEGWAVGLQLAGLSLQGCEDPTAFVAALSSSNRFILSYLTEEILGRLSQDVQEFLLQTSILAKLGGELCDALTGREDGAIQLESLLAANLFLVPLDDEGQWYRYHNLFAELLQTRLRRSHAERVAELHRRAGRWLEANGFPAEALDHAFAVGDYGHAMELLEIHIVHLLNLGYVRRVEAWMQAIPVGQCASTPCAYLGLAWIYLLRGNFRQVMSHWQQAAAALSGHPGQAGLQAECLALRANLMQVQGDVAGARETARRSLQLVEPGNRRVAGLAYVALGSAHRQAGDFVPTVETLQNAISASREAGDLIIEMLAVSHLAIACLQHGKLHLAAEAATEAIARSQRSSPAPPWMVGAVYSALGMVYYEWDQTAKAHDCLERGLRLGTFSGHNGTVIYTRVSLAKLLQAEGDLAGAERALAEAGALFEEGAPNWLRSEMIARQVSLLVAQSRLAEAEAVLRQSGIATEAPVTHETDGVHLAWLRLLSARRSPRAIDLAYRVIGSAEAGERHGTLLQALILAALLPGEEAKIRHDWLARGVALAEPEGYVRVFVDEGAPLAELMRQVDGGAYGESLLAHFPTIQGLGRIADLVEPLTEREMEVLRLLAEGLRYAEIAERLFVSINTVRYHVKEVYGKLGVDRQARAVERARDLHLL